MTPRQLLIQKLREAARQAELAHEPHIEVMLIELISSMHDGTEEMAVIAFLRSTTQLAIAVRAAGKAN